MFQTQTAPWPSGKGEEKGSCSFCSSSTDEFVRSRCVAQVRPIKEVSGVATWNKGGKSGPENKLTEHLLLNFLLTNEMNEDEPCSKSQASVSALQLPLFLLLLQRVANRRQATIMKI